MLRPPRAPDELGESRQSARPGGKPGRTGRRCGL